MSEPSFTIFFTITLIFDATCALIGSQINGKNEAFYGMRNFTQEGRIEGR